MNDLAQLSVQTKKKDALMECAVLTAFITVIWGITCAAREIWPFGTTLFDFNDMAAQYVPAYTHLWDVLHGRKSFWFDWYTGLGNNMAGADLHFGLISPFNLFFFFVRRSAIEKSMSVYVWIKLLAIGYSMRFVLKKWFQRLSAPMCLALTLLYVFSVFNLQYYNAVMWLDLSFIFPLVIYGYFLLMDENRRMPYTVILTVTLMMNFQHTYLVLLMLLWLTVILPLFDRERYGRRLPKLLGSTILAMMMASWIWIPACLQIAGSARADLRMSMVEIWNSVWILHTAKWMKLLNLGIPLSLFVWYACRKRKGKDVAFLTIVIALLAAPIVLESTNILWHAGPYQGYTMRFSYMLAFWIIIAGAYAGNQRAVMAEGVPARAGLRSNFAGWISFAAYIALMTGQYLLLKSDADSVYKDGVSAFSIILLVVFSVIFGMGMLRVGRHRYDILAVIVAAYSVITLALNIVITVGSVDDSYVTMGNEAAADYDGSDDPLIRMKSLDALLCHNYPLIVTCCSASNYLVANSQRQEERLWEMGYAQTGYRMSDYGGTLFTDALLGVDEVISGKAVDETLYGYEKTYGDYSIYKNLYRYGEGIRVKGKLPGKAAEGESPFDYQNRLAESVLGDGALLEISEAQGGGEEISLTVDDQSVLYLYSEQAAQFERVTVRNMDTGEERVCESPALGGWMNGILELGTYENAALQIQVQANVPINRILCAVMPLQRFSENTPAYCDDYRITRQGNSLHISLAGAEQAEYLLVPLYHDPGWRAVVNGRAVPIGEFADYLIAVPLEQGVNEITLSFAPRGLVPGMIVSLLGVLLTAVGGKFHFREDRRWPERILLALDRALLVLLLLIFYVIPVLFLLIRVVRALL